jgi:hypothetical protein
MDFRAGSCEYDPICPHCGHRISIDGLEAPCEVYGDCPVCKKTVGICMQVEVTIC